MVNILLCLGGLASLGALILWMRWLYTPSDSYWPQGYLRSTLLHGVPSFLGLFTLVMFSKFAKAIGAPADVVDAITGVPILLLLANALLVILVYLGVPAPPFCIPKWIREQDRERRTLKKAFQAEQREKKAAASAAKTARDRKTNGEQT